MVLEDLPTGMLERHGNFTLETDIMYVNKIPFVITILCTIHFCMAVQS